MLCLIALLTFGTLGVFSARYRLLAREALSCVLRKMTLRPCVTAFDQKLKGRVTAQLMTFPRLARLWHRHFELISWAFTLALFSSLGYVTYGIYNLVTIGRCDPWLPFCLIYDLICTTEVILARLATIVMTNWAPLGAASLAGAFAWRVLRVRPRYVAIVAIAVLALGVGYASLGPPQRKTIGGFVITNDAVCMEAGLPVLYLFGASWCPHCRWLHPIVQEVASQFDGYIVFHDNMDSDADKEVWERYGGRYIPVTVIGCRYYRVGTAHEREGDVQAEADEMRALICTLTGGQPEQVCGQVQWLIDQIEA